MWGGPSPVQGMNMKKQMEIEIEPPPVPDNQCEGVLRGKRCPRPAVVKGDGFCHRHAKWNMVLSKRGMNVRRIVDRD